MGEAFDPNRCKNGDKHFVYWAARNQLFRFRYDSAKPIYPSAGQEGSGGMTVMGHADIPAAPDPSEREGCYGNPLRGGAVPYMDSFRRELLRKLTGREVAPIYGWRQGYFALPNHLVGRSANQTYEKLFQTGRNCSRRESGIFVCDIGKTTEHTEIKSNRMLKIDANAIDAKAPDIYVGMKPGFNVHIRGRDDKLKYELSSEFDLLGSVSIRDNFEIYLSEIDILIPYYRDIVRYVTTAHVSSYQWTPAKTK